jgi:predicted site-specific integrase-resolvase
LVLCVKNEAGQRLYNVESYIRGAANASLICYCRVSSSKQKDDLHRQIAFLQSLYPEAEVVKDIFELILSHYRFKQFLKHKAFETGKIVLDVNEAYTSKTISWTGEIVHNLGGRKTIKDSNGIVMDRDSNGGRGIFLRSLVDIPSLQDCIVNVS